MSTQLPERPSLERLRREARRLQQALAEREAAAIARLAAALPGREPAAILAQAQAVIAREHGFPSWPRLKAAIGAADADRANAVRSDAELLAGRWIDLARQGDLPALLRALAVGKRRLEAARERMRADAGAYAGFVDFLIGGLDHRRPRVRFECAHALDSFGGPDCRPRLAALMDDPAPRVRWMAMHALSCHACNDAAPPQEPEVEVRIVQAVHADPSLAVRRHAAVALGLAGGPLAEPTLRRVLAEASDGKLLRNAAWALKQLRPAIAERGGAA